MIRLLRHSTLARNTMWMFVGQGVRLFIQALYFALIARSLGATNYGAFVAVAALVGVTYPFGTLGSGNLLIRDVSRDQNCYAPCLARALATTVISSSVLFVVVVSLARFALPGTIPVRLVGLIAGADLFGFSVINVCAQAFQAFERLGWTAIINVLFSAGRLVAAIALVLVNRHPSALQWGYVYCCSTAVVAVASLTLVLTKLGPPRWGLQRSAQDIREGLYFSVGLSAQTIYNDVDKTMLARLSTLDATGIYGAAYRLIDVSFIPVGALLAAAYPNFFRAGADGLAGSLRYARPLLSRALGYSVLASTALLLFAGVVPYVLGQEYARTVEALRWLAVLPMLKSLHYFLSDALTGAGYQGVRTAVQAGVAAVNVLINLWIIPLYSWRGAAWSSIASDSLLVCGIGLAVLVLSRKKARENHPIPAGAIAADEI